MKIAFHNRQRRKAVDSRALALEFERLLLFVSDELRADPPAWLKKRQLQQIFLHGHLSLVLVSNKTIRRINKQWRNQDKATDVLSFPLELTAPQWLQLKPRSRLAGKNSLDFDQDDDQDQWLVGELIISLERAQEQAQDFGHSIERELAFLFVHGVLHVFGFDHITKEEEKKCLDGSGASLMLPGLSGSKVLLY